MNIQQQDIEEEFEIHVECKAETIIDHGIVDVYQWSAKCTKEKDHTGPHCGPLLELGRFDTENRYVVWSN